MATYIYLVTNCYDDPNKVYIGKTKGNRKPHHKKTYGENILYNIIDKIESENRKDWKSLESYWIEQFRQWGFDVQNKNEGGNGCDFHTFETRKKISNSKLGNIYNLGRKFTKDHKNNIKLNKTGLKYNITKKGIQHGNFDKIRNEEWIRKQHLSKIGKKFSKELCLKISKSKIGKNIKSIIQYDLNMNFIKEWPSLKEASSNLNIKSGDISAVSNNKQKTAGGFVWKFK